MKIKNIYSLILVLVVLVSACELPDNRDPKSATDVPAETLMANAVRNSLALIDNMSQNTNISRMMCQYIGMTQYTDRSRYVFDVRQIPDGYWNTSYLVLQDLKEVKKLIQDLSGSDSFNRMNANRLAIVDILEVLVYHNLVDIFGNVPYTEALGGFDKLMETCLLAVMWPCGRRPRPPLRRVWECVWPMLIQPQHRLNWLPPSVPVCLRPVRAFSFTGLQ